MILNSQRQPDFFIVLFGWCVVKNFRASKSYIHREIVGGITTTFKEKSSC